MAKPAGPCIVGQFPLSLSERTYTMTSECKGGGKFVGKWSVSARNTTPCPVCSLPQPVSPYGGRYKIADHREPDNSNGVPPTGGS
jgi:hypothetical protein